MKLPRLSLKISLLLLLLILLPSFYLLIKPGFFNMQDDLQAFRIHQMDKCFQDLQLPCRWVPDAGYQFGYPQFLFYSPSVYYLGELFHLVGFQFIDAVKILFILGFITSALTMFLLLQAVFDRWSALVGAVIYAYMPYKAVEVYVRGAMSEFWSLVLFPLVLWSSFQLVKHQNRKYAILFALSAALQLVTHNLMSMIFLPIVGIWVLTWIYLEKTWRVLPKVILYGLLGIGLSSFYLVPLIIERPLVHLESLLGGYFDYRQHFVDLNQLFISNHWGYGSSQLGPGDDLSLSTGQVGWIAGLAAVALALLYFKKQRKLSIVLLVLAAVEVVVLFLMHQKSSFIWFQIPQLWYLQFPWRFLAVSILILSILSAGLIFQIKSNKLKLIVGIVIISLNLALYGSFFKPQKWFNISDRDKFSGISWEKQLTISIFDYLPIYATLPPSHKAPLVPEVLDGQAEFLSYHKGSNYQYGKLIVESQNATIRLPLFDYPGMVVKLDQQQISHYHSDCRLEPYCFGLITFNGDLGAHSLEVSLTKTWDRVVGDSLTVLSIFIMVGLWLRKKLYATAG